LTKYEVQELIKKQMLEGGRFNRVSKVATGTVTSNYTYTMPDTESFVMTPDQDSVKEIIDSINRVEDGEILKNTIQLK
ncbi:MAG: LytR family transcriptional regulator, partial [Agathobacter sp.]|nr:LytR family transcriptional regulator [Agathobacter sp.]